MAQFYTLEEAARALGMDPEELKSKAQRREVRAFLDSGSWRFRVSDIDELARRSGMGSDPDLSLSDIDLVPEGSGASSSGISSLESAEADIDDSVFQLGVARSDLGPVSQEDVPAQGSGSDADILLDDASLPMGGGSSSHIIGMEAPGKRPSDSDVRLVPEGPKGASDSDVSLSGEVDVVAPGGPADSDVTLVQEGNEDTFESFGTLDYEQQSSSTFGSSLGASDSGIQLGDSGSDETTLRPAPIGSSDEIKAEVEGASSEEEDSDFELTPSSVIDALQPESGSDFELTALDASDEFEAVAPKPSDSDVTGAEPSTSGVNLGKPSDSGINLQQMGGLDDADSIELAPLDDDDAKPAPPKPKPAPRPAADPAATAMPGLVPDPSATALPVRDQSQKDIFEDTDFEVDALESGEDQTMQLDANSDFDLDESDSASEVFALDEEDVDQNAATAMGPAVLEEEDAVEGAMKAEVADSEEMESVTSWDEEGAPSSAAVPAGAARRGGPQSSLLSDAGGPPWGGLWVGMLSVTTVLMMVLAFITMDVVRNLNTYEGDTPVVSGLVRMVAGGE
ncbi:helix-turn-helix domain-containing protein [Tautonia sociabilis]|uniref:DNA-binding protein n=1 Tax=Tautonia sociabilis TaxID=2080755 RepID=A0A432MQC5_9BACT|nr:helix-turn-helix domain-containing protein [Tautonia sociabilis]RUL89255.1 DNA-binding protein [Tautonia sociabilis]